MKLSAIDITKPKLSPMWLVTLFVVIIVALGIWHGANWAYNQVLDLAKPAEKTEQLKGVLPD